MVGKYLFKIEDTVVETNELFLCFFFARKYG